MQWNYEKSTKVFASQKDARSGVIWLTDGLPACDAVIFADFDGTLVEFKGRTFNAGELIYKRDVVEAMKAMAQHYSAPVIIVSNQAWNVDPQLIQGRLYTGMMGLRAMGLNVAAVYAGVGKDFYRKPLPGMAIKALELRGGATPVKKYMVGDAAGRPGDFSSSDYEFALNIGADFYTPESLVSRAQTGVRLVEPIQSPCKDLFVGKFANLGGRPQCNAPVHPIEIVAMCGVPGSGKTQVARALEKVGYVRISADEIKGDATKKLEEVAAGKSIVFDRTHYSVEQRKYVVDFAKRRNMPIRILYIDEELNASRAKMKARFLLGGTYVSERAPVWRIAPPTVDEGFTIVEHIRPKIDLDVASPEFVDKIKLIYG